MKRGKLWYHREPHAYLGGVQGLPKALHAVYGIVIELIYANGGTCQNDPRWIAGWISDMGAAAVRTAITDLCARGKLHINGEYLTNARATIETTAKVELSSDRAKFGAEGGRATQQKRRETGGKLDQFLPGFSSDREVGSNKINGLDQARARDRVEKIREEKKEEPKSDDLGAKSLAEIIFDKGLSYLVRNGMAEGQARSMLGKWRKAHGEEKLLEALRRSQQVGASDPLTFVTGCLKGQGEKATASDHIMADLKRRAGK